MIRGFLCQCSLRIQKKWRLLTVNVLPCAECGLEPFGSNVYSTKSNIYFLTQQRLKMIKNWRSNWSHGHAHATYVWLYVESPFCCEQNSFVSIVVERRVVSRLGYYWIHSCQEWSRGSITSKEESNLIWCGCCSVCSALTSPENSLNVLRWYKRGQPFYFNNSSPTIRVYPVCIKDNVEHFFLNLIT